MCNIIKLNQLICKANKFYRLPKTHPKYINLIWFYSLIDENIFLCFRKVYKPLFLSYITQSVINYNNIKWLRLNQQ